MCRKSGPWKKAKNPHFFFLGGRSVRRAHTTRQWASVCVCVALISQWSGDGELELLLSEEGIYKCTKVERRQRPSFYRVREWQRQDLAAAAAPAAVRCPWSIKSPFNTWDPKERPLFLLASCCCCCRLDMVREFIADNAAALQLFYARSGDSRSPGALGRRLLLASPDDILLQEIFDATHSLNFKNCASCLRPCRVHKTLKNV